MSDAATTRKATRATPKTTPEASRRRRQKLWRSKRKARFLEVLAMLEAIPDDAPIIIEPGPK